MVALEWSALAFNVPAGLAMMRRFTTSDATI
jgi:hypothetical protein